MMAKLILLLKAHVKAHARRLASGKVIQVGAYSTKVPSASTGEHDTKTRDMLDGLPDTTRGRGTPGGRPATRKLSPIEAAKVDLAGMPHTMDLFALDDRPILLIPQELASLPKHESASIDQNSSMQQSKELKMDAIKTALSGAIDEVATRVAGLLQDQFNGLAAKFGPGMSGIANSTSYNVWNEVIKPITDNDAQPDPSRPGMRYLNNYTVSPVKLAAAARKQAEQSVLAWENKIREKLGELSDAKVTSIGGARFIVEGRRGGKSVRVDQDMIINVSSKGRLFNQYPARITVDGKATSAAAYEKLFAGDAAPQAPVASATEQAQPANQEAATPVAAPADRSQPLSVTAKRRVRADVVAGQHAHTVVTLSDGSTRRLQRNGAPLANEIGGWHDLDSKSMHTYLGDTEDEAIAVLVRRLNAGRAAAVAPAAVSAVEQNSPGTKGLDVDPEKQQFIAKFIADNFPAPAPGTRVRGSSSVSADKRIERAEAAWASHSSPNKAMARKLMQAGGTEWVGDGYVRIYFNATPIPSSKTGLTSDVYFDVDRGSWHGEAGAVDAVKRGAGINPAAPAAEVKPAPKAPVAPARGPALDASAAKFVERNKLERHDDVRQENGRLYLQSPGAGNMARALGLTVGSTGSGHGVVVGATRDAFIAAATAHIAGGASRVAADDAAVAAARAQSTSSSAYGRADAAAAGHAAGRAYLDVPFANKDAVKAAGAKWDADARKWYWPGKRDEMPAAMKKFYRGAMASFSV